MTPERDIEVKVVIVGDVCVGKTSLVRRFVDGTYNSTDQPICLVEFSMCTFDPDGHKVQLELWDTSGSEHLRAAVSNYFRGAQGIIVVYDATDMQSFEDARRRMQEIDKYAPDGVNRLLLGSKCDLSSRRQVHYDWGKELADFFGMQFLETSAQNAHNVDQVFQMMVPRPLLLQAFLDGTSVQFVTLAGDEFARVPAALSAADARARLTAGPRSRTPRTAVSLIDAVLPGGGLLSWAPAEEAVADAVGRAAEG